MKLVELLARELQEWPEGVVRFCQSLIDDELYGEDEVGDCIFRLYPDSECGRFSSNDEYEYVTRAQWQAERERQKGGEWKRHRGGSRPVDEGTWVEVKLRCGDVQQGLANAFLWRHAECDHAVNIMQYKVVSQQQAEDGLELVQGAKDSVISCVGPFPSAPEGESLNQLECDIQFPSGVCSMESKTEQMETPFKWRDQVTELNAYIEKFTRERDELIERLASEGFALIPPVVGVVSEFAGVDMSDWRNWKVGDVVSVKDDCDLDDGEYTILEIEHPEYDWDMPVKTEAGWPDITFAKLKFIRRP